MDEFKITLHVADVDGVRLLLLGRTIDFKIEPVLMAMGVGVDPQVQIVFVFSNFGH